MRTIVIVFCSGGHSRSPVVVVSPQAPVTQPSPTSAHPLEAACPSSPRLLWPGCHLQLSGVQRAFVLHDRRVSVDGLSAQYLEAGTGPPLLLLHGHAQSATGWRWVIPDLARTHRVLALSLPGHGDTAAVGAYPPGRDASPFVAAFLDALGIESLDVVGHSGRTCRVAARRLLSHQAD